MSHFSFRFAGRPLLAGCLMFGVLNGQEQPPASSALASAAQKGQGQGKRQGRGPDARLRADQDVFHYLLGHHQKITRTVTKTATGIESLTESSDPAVAAKIKEHVLAMERRVKEGRGLRFWDELFVAIFNRHKAISMAVDPTDKGVRVKEYSDDPIAVKLIQAHADVVSSFVKLGFEEAEQNHPVPASAKPTKAVQTPSEKPVVPVVPKEASSSGSQQRALVFPIIKGVGGVLPRPHAVEQPTAGAKVVFDATGASQPGKVNTGLDRVARLLNLYGSAGLKASDVSITIVLHGEATSAALSDAAYSEKLGQKQNPNLPLIRALKEAGVQVLVCGQALNYKGFADDQVANDIPIAASAMSVIVNKQRAGFAYIPVPN